jgi:methylmalonyl-CoA mutase C-terminal domain/subunit
MTPTRKLKVVIAKAGLDGHERGAHAVTALLRDAGMETVYLGMFQTPQSIVSAAIDEDADVVGLSALNGEHIHFTQRVIDHLRQEGLDDVLVIVGGIVPVEDVPVLNEMGVSGVFPAGTLFAEIKSFINDNVRAERPLA